ncbi:DMT family transporter [Halofilum ochraceum]|uniref:DMT family transporter n=1 Tax=Halofilum ochraceum TaxID=1611323 RepID=UPI0008370496|nr:DMT family transporter [Halofilum ochraceum]
MSPDPGNTGTPLWLRAAPVLFLLFWSAGFTFGKLGLEHAEPMTFLAMRYGSVLIVLLPLVLLMRPPLPRRAADWGHLAAVGTLIQGIYFGLTYYSFELGISAGGVALIVSLQPILVALFVPWTAGEKVGLRRWAGLIMGLTGAMLVIAARSAVGATSMIGILAAVAALVSITGGTLYEKRFGVSHHPVTANAIQYLVAFALILPVAMLTETMQVEWVPELYISLGYLVVFNSLIAITLLLAMIRHGEAARVSALFFLVPPGAALIAWGVLGETMPLLAWPGIVLAAIGVAIAARTSRG